MCTCMEFFYGVQDGDFIFFPVVQARPLVCSLDATVLDAVLPETLRIPCSLPELFPDAQNVAERIKEALFLQKDLRDKTEVDTVCSLHFISLCVRDNISQQPTSLFIPLGSRPVVLTPEIKLNRNKSYIYFKHASEQLTLKKQRSTPMVLLQLARKEEVALF